MFTYLLPGIGMIVVALAALFLWRRLAAPSFRWFAIGAGLWLAAVVLKLVVSGVTNPAILSALQPRLGPQLVAVFGGLAIGVQSSLFEIGLTFIAVLIWRRLGLTSDRAIAIGVGAGAFEALLLGLSQLVSTLLALGGVEGTEAIRQQLDPAVLPTLFWLLAPVERVIAILTHAGSRALVLLGTAHRRTWLVVAGFGVFAALDSIAAGSQLIGIGARNSLWLVEAALLPIGLISLAILRWCHQRWPPPDDHPAETADAAAG
jgi:hypothetical protein